MTIDRPPTSMRYAPAGLDAATSLVAAAASDLAAKCFAGLAGLRRAAPTRARFGFGILAQSCGLGEDRDAARERLHAADDAFFAAFGLHLVADRPDAAGSAIDDRHEALGVTIAQELIEMLEHPPAFAPRPSAVLDEAGMDWVSIVKAASCSERGHHLVLRVSGRGARAAADFASLVGACHTPVILWEEGEPLRQALLKAELFGAGRAVVVANGDFLVLDAAETVADDEFAAPGAPPEKGPTLAPGAAGTLGWMKHLRNTYVWRIPGRGPLPAELDGLIGACIGPVAYDPAWGAAHIRTLAPGIGAAATRAILQVVADARDAKAIAALAKQLARCAVAEMATVDAACLLLSASFGAEPPSPKAHEPGRFDERLIACEPDGLALLTRGHVVAKGGRVVAHGPPGGGKSSYAKALAASIAAAGGAPAPIMVEPASLLAKSWGATERLLAAFWDRARREGATIIADEFDSMGALRDADAPASGNGYLIRCLTNEWLRQLDAHPDVPFIATVNDLAALDPAIRRRIPVAIEVRDELSPEQERIAWDAILGLQPPDGWTPCRACIADFTSAAERCRLLGRADAASHAAAVAQARSARLGKGAEGRGPHKKGRLH